MTIFSSIRTRALSWWNDVPLPNGPDIQHIFQLWNEFDPSSQQWKPVNHSQMSIKLSSAQSDDSTLSLVTWNVDAISARPEARISAILIHILELGHDINVIFLQEVSRAALIALLADERIRQNWRSSEADDHNWADQKFATMTLVSKPRSQELHSASSIPGMMTTSLGPIWRTKLPSRFGRDALCCDFLVNSSSQAVAPSSSTTTARIRLINVHLDSLPIQPSRRPRQIAIAASLLRQVTSGLVAGDFNPVLPEDGELLQLHHLNDVWSELRPNDAGFTWGLDGEQPFPPNRLDRIATWSLQASDIEVLNPGMLSDEAGDYPIPWSDHSGIRCTFQL